MGELHLEVLVDRMLREFKVQAKVGVPRVAYRESITKSVPQLEYRYIKQTGGRGHFAHVVLSVEPGEQGSGIKFEERIKGGVIPREFISAVEKAMASDRAMLVVLHQWSDHPLAKKIRGTFQVITVTRENRDVLAEEISRALRGTPKGTPGGKR
jgi:translation elongation factor EF-G